MGRVDGEERIIGDYFAQLAEHAGAFNFQDDCALITPGPGQSLVFKTDPVRAGVHFLADDAPEDIAWKAVAVNVSDLAAKGARPLGYLLAQSFPQAPDAAWLSRFVDGLRVAQDAFGMFLLGGDTDRADGPFSIAVTVIGEMPAQAYVQRGRARAGDALYVTGTLGDSALGLALHTGEKRADELGLSDFQARACRDRYLRPQPRLGARAAVRAYGRAAMDLSDGLVKDAGRMMRASGCGCEVALADVPLSQAGAAARDADPGFAITAITHGDDYELLVAVAPENCSAFQSLARAGGVLVTRVGGCSDVLDVRVVDRDGREVSVASTGYDHFGGR